MNPIKLVLFQLVKLAYAGYRMHKTLEAFFRAPGAVCYCAATQGAYVSEYRGYNEETGKYEFDAEDYEPENQINGILVTDNTPLPIGPNGEMMSKNEFTAKVLETIETIKAELEAQEEEDDIDSDLTEEERSKAADELLSLFSSFSREHEVGDSL